MSTWEERMSQRAQTRMAIAEAEQIARDAANGVTEEPGWATLHPGSADGQAMNKEDRRRRLAAAREARIPRALVLAAELPDGAEDVARHWCTSCGLADPPMREIHWDPTPPCSRCGSTWRWYGRIADRDGTATGPPPKECTDCSEWRRFPPGQEHFGWRWWSICRRRTGVCEYGHDHHDGEIALA